MSNVSSQGPLSPGLLPALSPSNALWTDEELGVQGIARMFSEQQPPQLTAVQGKAAGEAKLQAFSNEYVHNTDGYRKLADHIGSLEERKSEGGLWARILTSVFSIERLQKFGLFTEGCQKILMCEQAQKALKSKFCAKTGKKMEEIEEPLQVAKRERTREILGQWCSRIDTSISTATRSVDNPGYPVDELVRGRNRERLEACLENLTNAQALMRGYDERLKQYNSQDQDDFDLVSASELDEKLEEIESALRRAEVGSLENMRLEE